MIGKRLKPLVKTGGFFIVLLSLLFASGCALLRGVSEPEVTLTSISFGGSQSMTQIINLGLRVQNPNSFALKFNKLNYRIFLEDSEVASGRRAEPLTIEANDHASFSVPFELNLFSGLSLAEKLIRRPKNTLDYRLEVDADIANFGLGVMTLRKDSTIRFDP